MVTDRPKTKDNVIDFVKAKQKLQNFRDKAIRLEGLYKELSNSLSIESTAKTIERRKDLFKSIMIIIKELSLLELEILVVVSKKD